MSLKLRTKQVGILRAEIIRHVVIHPAFYVICTAPISFFFFLSHAHLFHDEQSILPENANQHDRMEIINFGTISNETEHRADIQKFTFHQYEIGYMLALFPYILQFALNFFLHGITNQEYRRCYMDYIKHLMAKNHFKNSSELQRKRDVVSSIIIAKRRLAQKEFLKNKVNLSNSIKRIMSENSIGSHAIKDIHTSDIEKSKTERKRKRGTVRFSMDDSTTGSGYLCHVCQSRQHLMQNSKRRMNTFAPLSGHSDGTYGRGLLQFGDSHLKKRRLSI